MEAFFTWPQVPILEEIAHKGKACGDEMELDLSPS
jgi:hypothetical protein